jgi:hypothetical protein
MAHDTPFESLDVLVPIIPLRKFLSGRRSKCAVVGIRADAEQPDE